MHYVFELYTTLSLSKLRFLVGARVWTYEAQLDDVIDFYGIKSFTALCVFDNLFSVPMIAVIAALSATHHSGCEKALILLFPCFQSWKSLTARKSVHDKYRSIRLIGVYFNERIMNGEKFQWKQWLPGMFPGWVITSPSFACVWKYKFSKGHQLLSHAFPSVRRPPEVFIHLRNSWEFVHRETQWNGRWPSRIQAQLIILSGWTAANESMHEHLHLIVFL